MRIAFLSSWDPCDPHAWSGVVHRMFQALSSRAELTPVVTADIEPAFVDRLACRLSDSLADRRYLVGHALATGIKRGLLVQRRVAGADPHVVLAVAASQDVAFLRVSCPLVLVSDATFAAIRDYYPIYARLSRLSGVQGEIQEARSLSRARYCAAATRWACRSLVRDYSVGLERCGVVPFGPALEPEGPCRPRAVRGDRLRLLTVAGDWDRKGGDRCVAVFEDLQRRGIPVSLTVVGDAPALPPDVAREGRVDHARMRELYASHDVLLELARANCAGVTLTDAAAFGLPVVATDTGGVSTIVVDGVTGSLVDPLVDVVGAASQAVAELLSPSLYAQMSGSARLRHEQLLNWDAWSDAILRVCREVRGAA